MSVHFITTRNFLKMENPNVRNMLFQTTIYLYIYLCIYLLYLFYILENPFVIFAFLGINEI